MPRSTLTRFPIDVARYVARISGILRSTLVIIVILALLTVWAMLAFAVCARAGQRMDAARFAVNHAWNYPCGGHWKLNVTSDFPDNVLAAWKEDEPCTLHTRPASYMGYKLWCTILVHEGGHAVGLEHTMDPNSIMYPDWPTPTDYVYPLCKHDPTPPPTPHPDRWKVKHG